MMYNIFGNFYIHSHQPITSQEIWTRYLVDFTVPADHRMKMKRSQKHQTRKREEKLQKEIPIFVGALEKVTKNVVKRSEELEIR